MSGAVTQLARTGCADGAVVSTIRVLGGEDEFETVVLLDGITTITDRGDDRGAAVRAHIRRVQEHQGIANAGWIELRFP